MWSSRHKVIQPSTWTIINRFGRRCPRHSDNHIMKCCLFCRDSTDSSNLYQAVLRTTPVLRSSSSLQRRYATSNGLWVRNDHKLSLKGLFQWRSNSAATAMTKISLNYGNGSAMTYNSNDLYTCLTGQEEKGAGVALLYLSIERWT